MTEKSAMTAKNVVKELLPPLALTLARRLRHRFRPPTPEYECVPDGWARRAELGVRGYPHTAAQMAQARQSVPALREAAQGSSWLAAQPSVLHNQIMTAAYVLGRAAQGRRCLSVLDFGGALGVYSLYLRPMFPELDLDWHVLEQAHLAQIGAELTPEVTYHAGDAWAGRQYDLVMASCSLQYLEDWRAALRALAGATKTALLITRLPSTDAPSYTYVQRPSLNPAMPHHSGVYLDHCFNTPEFLEAVGGEGFHVDREFGVFEGPDVVGAPGPCRYRGWLFLRSPPAP